ncbi:MAG: helix-turn-helix domain-containing protein [Candidatus Sulfotelmatobacter sp.]
MTTNRKFQIQHSTTRYILRNADPTTLLVYISIGLHADRNTGACYPSRETLARLIGLRDVRIITRCVAKLVALGLVERRDLGFRRWELRVVRTDASRDYMVIDERFLSGYVGQDYAWDFVRRGEPVPLFPRHDGVGIVGCALFALLCAMANGRREFTTSVKAIVELSRLSRGTVDAAMLEIEAYMLIDTRTPASAFGQIAVTIPRNAASFVKVEPSQTAQTFAKDAVMAAEPSQTAHPELAKPSQNTHSELYKPLTPNCTKAFDPELNKGEDSARKSGERPVPAFSDLQTESKSNPAVLITDGKPTTFTAKQLAAAYRAYYERRMDATCPWDDGDTAATRRTIGRLAGWSAEQYERCLENLFGSKDGRSTKKASFVLRYIHEYIDSPLNRFNRPLEWKDLTIQEQLRISGGRATGAFHRDEVSDYAAGADVVFDNSPAKQPEPEQHIDATVVVVNKESSGESISIEELIRKWDREAKGSRTPRLLGSVDETCQRLYCVTPQNGCSRRESFTGKHREALADLLREWTGDEIVSAYREFVRRFNDFEMANAPKHFVEGGATAVLRTQRNFKVALEEDKAQEAQRREQRRREQETRNQELERIGREQMQELEEALANPIRTWQPSGQAA